MLRNTLPKNKAFVTAFLLVITASCSRQPASNTATGTTPETRIASTDVVKAKPDAITLSPGATGAATVHIVINNGYHVNANPPSYPYLKATELDITKTGDVSVSFITYPDPINKKFAFAEKPLAVYEGEVTVRATLKADKSAKLGTQNLSAKLRVQACDEQVCYAPGELGLTIPVTIK